MDTPEDEDDGSGSSGWGWFFFLVFLFPPLILLAIPLLPFWLLSREMGSDPPPEPADIPPPVRSLPKRPQPKYRIFPSKSDYDGPENLWWDVDDVHVGSEHNRPEGEWWDL